MYLALVILVALVLAVAAAVLLLVVLADARVRRLLAEVRATRAELHGLTESIGATIVNVVDNRPPLGGPAFGGAPFGRSTVQSRADGEPEVPVRSPLPPDDTPTQTYGAVRPQGRP